MPKVIKRRRKPIKQDRFGGVSVSIQRFTRPPYVCRVVLREDGEVTQQKYCTTQDEAKTLADEWVAKTTSVGVKAAATITEADERNLMNWREQLAFYHRDLKDAVEFYLKHLKATRSSKGVREAIDALLANKEKKGKRDRYQRDLGNKLDRFEEHFEGRMIGDITAKEVEKWLDSLEVGPVTWNNYRRNLCVLWNFAVRQKWAEKSEEAWREIEPMEEEPLSPEVLSPDEARKLMNAAGDEVRAYYAIALFGGVRDEELRRLEWKSVNLMTGYITIEKGVAKTKRKRLVPICDSLRKWLTPVAKTRGMVTPEKPRPLLEKARADAGIEVWPHDATRHSFGTYAMAKHKDIGWVSEVMGNSPNVVKTHYQKAVPFEQGDEFFSICPPEQEGENKILPMVPAKDADAPATVTTANPAQVA